MCPKKYPSVICDQNQVVRNFESHFLEMCLKHLCFSRYFWFISVIKDTYGLIRLLKCDLRNSKFKLSYSNEFLSQNNLRHGVGKPQPRTLRWFYQKSMRTYQAHYLCTHVAQMATKNNKQQQNRLMCLLCATCVQILVMIFWSYKFKSTILYLSNEPYSASRRHLVRFLTPVEV